MVSWTAIIFETQIRTKYPVNLFTNFVVYCRFYGRIAKQPDNHEEPILEAIRNNVTGLEKISGERIWIEMKKILGGNFAGELMLTMIECGIGPHIGNVQEYY